MNDFKININRNIIPVGSNNKINTQDKPSIKQNIGFENILYEKISSMRVLNFQNMHKRDLCQEM